MRGCSGGRRLWWRRRGRGGEGGGVREGFEWIFGLKVGWKWAVVLTESTGRLY